MPNNFKKKFIRGVTGSFGLKIANTGLLFLLSLILARCLGVEGFGTYSYAFSWVAFLSIPASLGCNNLLTREVAIYQTQQSWGLLKGLLQWTNFWVFLISSLLALLAIATSWLLVPHSNSSLLWTLSIAFLSLPLMTLRLLRVGAMQGFHQVVLALVPEFIFTPTLIILGVGIIYLFIQSQVNVITTSLISIIIILISFCLGGFWLNQVIPNTIKTAQPQYNPSIWLKTALPLMFLGSVQIINSRIDTLMLGILQGTQAVAVYVIVTNATQLIVFSQMAVNNVLAPNIAELYSSGNMDRLQNLVTKCARIVFLISFLTTGIVILARDWLLQLFGTEFSQGANALIILAVAQLVNASTGPVGILLNMTGYERYTVITSSLSTILKIFLNLILIPKMGVNGAAIAAGVAVVFTNTLNCLWVAKKIKIGSTALG